MYLEFMGKHIGLISVSLLLAVFSVYASVDGLYMSEMFLYGRREFILELSNDGTFYSKKTPLKSVGGEWTLHNDTIVLFYDENSPEDALWTNSFNGLHDNDTLRYKNDTLYSINKTNHAYDDILIKGELKNKNYHWLRERAVANLVNLDVVFNVASNQSPFLFLGLIKASNVNWAIIQDEKGCYNVYSGCYNILQGGNGKLNEVDKVNRNDSIIQWGLEKLPTEANILEIEGVQNADDTDLRIFLEVYDANCHNLYEYDSANKISYRGESGEIFMEKLRNLISKMLCTFEKRGIHRDE